MRIELFSDFTCPFCYIGKKQLELAIKEAGYEGQVELVHKAYQLDPNAPTENAPRYLAQLKAKFNDDEKMAAMLEEVTAHAKDVGLAYDFSEMKIANTEKLHRLAKWANKYNKESQVVNVLTEGYFTQHLDLNNEDEVMAELAKIDLPIAEAKEVYHSAQFVEKLDEDRYDAQQIGVQSVPFFVFENRYGIIGAEPSEVFVRTLHQAAEIAGDKPALQTVGSTANTCTDDVCGI